MGRPKVDRVALTISVTPRTRERLAWIADYIGTDMSDVVTGLVIKRYEYLSAKQRKESRFANLFSALEK